jgi:hypothetical protein
VWVEARLSISKVERFFFYLRVEMSVSTATKMKKKTTKEKGVPLEGCLVAGVTGFSQTLL